MIRLMVVDDSAFMRMAIANMIKQDDGIEIIGQASNGEVAVQMANKLRPDVITMDVEMPIMNGLDAVKHIMLSRPCPIIMVSSLTPKGGESTIKAMQLGAVDFIAKSSSFIQLDIAKVEIELLEKLNYWGHKSLSKAIKEKSVKATVKVRQPISSRRVKLIEKKPVKLVVVAVSTGGPKAVLELLKNTGPLACPMVIAQHMPKMFTPGFAEHLASETGLNVIEGYHGLALKNGLVVVAPGGTDSQIRQPFTNNLVLDVKLNKDASIHPSADVLFCSAAKNTDSAVAIILTGMGNDGTQGAQYFIENNFPVLVQEPSSCIVGGMPGAAIEADVVSEILPIKKIGSQLKAWCHLEKSFEPNVST
jgi:two-component system chemotaxis response regulator CheB